MKQVKITTVSELLISINSHMKQRLNPVDKFPEQLRLPFPLHSPSCIQQTLKNTVISGKRKCIFMRPYLSYITTYKIILTWCDLPYPNHGITNMFSLRCKACIPSEPQACSHYEM